MSTMSETMSAAGKKRYKQLLALQEAGVISDLQSKVRYVLLPAQRDEDGNLLEKEVIYYADFVYRNNEQKKTIVEDLKSKHLDDYLLKRALMLYVHGIKIKEPKMR